MYYTRVFFLSSLSLSLSHPFITLHLPPPSLCLSYMRKGTPHFLGGICALPQRWHFTISAEVSATAIVSACTHCKQQALISCFGLSMEVLQIEVVKTTNSVCSSLHDETDVCWSISTTFVCMFATSWLSLSKLIYLFVPNIHRPISCLFLQHSKAVAPICFLSVKFASCNASLTPICVQIHTSFCVWSHWHPKPQSAPGSVHCLMWG